MLAMVLAVSFVVPPRTVRADEAADLEVGRALYADGKHAEAERYFAAAIDGPKPTLHDPQIVAQGRMLRGASDMYLGRKADADRQFELIVRAVPKFEPDAIAFPPGVLDELRRVRERLQKEEVVQDSARELATERAERLRLSQRYDSLRAFAREERVVTRHSRLIASIPFGVGQFQNGDTALGLFFAVTEGAAVASATVSFAIHEMIPRTGDIDTQRARADETTSRVVNLISVGAFLALAIGGIVQAHVAFVPASYETRIRPLPPALARVTPIVRPTDGGATFGLGVAF